MLKSVIVTKKSGDFYCTQIDTEEYPIGLLQSICTNGVGSFVCRDVRKRDGRRREIMIVGSEVSDIRFDDSLDYRFLLEV